jgi:hypothetical protein
MNDNSNFLFDLNESWSNQPLLQEPVPFEGLLLLTINYLPNYLYKKCRV